MEAAHAERAVLHERRVAMERRMDSYRSNIFTPSGRPYETLPVVSLGEMRQTLKHNTRGLYERETDPFRPASGLRELRAPPVSHRRG